MKSIVSSYYRSIVLILIVLLLGPLLKSSFFNIYKLTKNSSLNLKLNGIHKRFYEQKAILEAKLKNYQSYHGMKQTIKEEIKAIENNEILVRIVDAKE